MYIYIYTYIQWPKLDTVHIYGKIGNYINIYIYVIIYIYINAIDTCM